jgi:hypothetical protein
VPTQFAHLLALLALLAQVAAGAALPISIGCKPPSHECAAAASHRHGGPHACTGCHADLRGCDGGHAQTSCEAVFGGWHLHGSRGHSHDLGMRVLPLPASWGGECCGLGHDHHIHLPDLDLACCGSRPSLPLAAAVSVTITTLAMATPRKARGLHPPDLAARGKPPPQIGPIQTVRLRL